MTAVTITILGLLVAGDILAVISSVLLFLILRNKQADLAVSKALLDLNLEVAKHAQQKVKEVTQAAERITSVMEGNSAVSLPATKVQ